jgi:hypothetical protein
MNQEQPHGRAADLGPIALGQRESLTPLGFKVAEGFFLRSHQNVAARQAIQSAVPQTAMGGATDPARPARTRQKQKV